MGMVKRVVERAHRGVLPGSGSCELEPERNREHRFRWDILPELKYDLQNTLCLDPQVTEFADSQANFNVFALDAIS